MGSGKLSSIGRGCTAVTQGRPCSRTFSYVLAGFCNGYAKRRLTGFCALYGALKLLYFAIEFILVREFQFGVRQINAQKS